MYEKKAMARACVFAWLDTTHGMEWNETEIFDMEDARMSRNYSCTRHVASHI